MKTDHQIRGSLLLFIGAIIWGAAFAAQRAGMNHTGPFTFSGIRMLLASIALTPAVFLSEKKREHQKETDLKTQRKASALCGLFLFAATSLQQVGLVYTSAGKAGFITALYVVLVPLAGWMIFRNHPGRTIWIGVILAVIALYLLCVPAGKFNLESGDLLVLGCAVCFTFQILFIDRYADRVNGFRLARDEFMITGVLSMAIAMTTEDISLNGILEAMIPILYTGIMSGAVGYTLQIFGQRDTNPTVASLLMCLESVFAVLTGVILLGETMTGREIIGSILMMTAVMTAQLSSKINEFIHRKAEQKMTEKEGH